MGTRSQEAGGQCFTLALAEFLRSGLKLDCCALLVHGLPVGTGGEVRGLRYWHAWVEYEIRDNVFLVHDDTLEERFRLFERDTYYRIGQLSDEHVWRFTADQATEEMQTREHMGPWVDNWEDLEEV